MLPNYKVHGESGKPVLFFGGMMQPHSLLGPFVEMMVAKGFQIIRIGYRGHHNPEESDFRLEDIAADAIAVLNHLEVEKIDVIGEALGGTIALAMAQQYPDRINSICVSGVISKRDAEIAKMFLQWGKTLQEHGIEQLITHIIPDVFSYKWAVENPDKVAEVAKQMEEERTKEGLLALFVSTQKFRFSKDKVKTISTPTLIIAGLLDTIVPPGHAFNLHKLLPNSQLVKFECGHAVSCECPQQTLETFGQFVGALHKK